MFAVRLLSDRVDLMGRTTCVMWDAGLSPLNASAPRGSESALGETPPHPGLVGAAGRLAARLVPHLDPSAGMHEAPSTASFILSIHRMCPECPSHAGDPLIHADSTLERERGPFLVGVRAS